jgi:hypothetical protein
MKTKIEMGNDYSIEVNKPFAKDTSDGMVSLTTATAWNEGRCIAKFSGIHARQQCEAVVVMHRAGATEASLELCAADIGRAALHERSLKHHPMLLEV